MDTMEQLMQNTQKMLKELKDMELKAKMDEKQMQYLIDMYQETSKFLAEHGPDSMKK